MIYGFLLLFLPFICGSHGKSNGRKIARQSIIPAFWQTIHLAVFDILPTI